MCGVLGVPRATYYWMLSHPGPEPADDPIAADVVWIYGGDRREYGAPKIKRALARESIVAPRRRIKRIMNQKGLVSAYARKKYKPRASKASEAEAPNVPSREFDGHLPRTHIVGDLTYVRVGRGWGLRLPAGRPAQPRDRGARGKRQEGRGAGEGRLCHAGVPATDIDVLRTNRGSEFANSDIDDLPEAFDIRRSLSRKGDPYDNAAIEPANRTLKKGLVYRRAFADLGRLRRELNPCVRWRNEERMLRRWAA